MNAAQRFRLIKYLFPDFSKDFPTEKFGIADKYLLRKSIGETLEEFSVHSKNYLLGAFYVAVLKRMEKFGYSPDIDRRIKQDSSKCYSLLERNLKKKLDGD